MTDDRLRQFCFAFLAFFLLWYSGCERPDVQSRLPQQRKVTPEEIDQPQAEQEAVDRKKTHGNIKDYIQFNGLAGLSEEGIKYLLDLEADGETEYERRMLGDLERNDGDPGVFNIDVKVELRSGASTVGTVKPTNAAAPADYIDVKYVADPENSRAMTAAKIAYWQKGVEHFEKLETPEISPTDKAEAAKLMRATISRWHGVNLPNLQWEDLDKKMTSLADKSKRLMRDPMYLGCLSLAKTGVNDMAAADSLMTRVTMRFSFSDYPASTAFFFQLRGLDAAKSEQSVKNRLAQYFTSLRHWVKNDMRAQPEELAVVAKTIDSATRFLREIRNDNKLKVLEADLAENIDLPMWLRNYCRGCIANDLAWVYRGDGFVNTVNEKQWELFHEHQSRAAMLLVKAHEENPQSGLAAQRLTIIAESGSTKEDPDK